MEDEPLDLRMNSASSIKATSTEKQYDAEKDMRALPEKSNVTLFADFSSSVENSRRTSEQESKNYLYSHKINRIDKPLVFQDVITGSNSKTKRKMSEDPSKNSEAKRCRDTYSATSRKIEDKKMLPGASDYSGIASSHYISSRPSTRADTNNCYGSSVKQKHSTSRKNVSRFICEQCGKGFSYNSLLETHFRTHTGEKPFKCMQCEKTFSQKHSLEEHTIRVHTNLVKSYTCIKCEKSFALKRDLTIHSKRHTREKPFTCKECGKSFAIKNNLTDHSKDMQK